MEPASPKSINLELLPQSVANMPVPMHVTVAGTTLSLKDVCRLAAGSIVEFHQPASQPSDLVVNGKVLARGNLVTVQGNYGLKVSSLCPK